MSFQLFWKSPLNKDTIISIPASGIILRLQADSCTYQNTDSDMDILKKTKSHFILNTGKQSIVFFFFFQIAQNHEFVVDSFSRYVSIQAQFDDMSSLCSFSPNFYLHFLPLFLLPEGEWCWNLKSEKGGSNRTQNGINHTAVAPAGIDWTFMYLLFFFWQPKVWSIYTQVHR